MDKKGKVLIETFLALFLMCVLTPLAAAAGKWPPDFSIEGAE